jgi:hypothetical protein
MEMAALLRIVQGQAERNIGDKSVGAYLSRMTTLTKLLFDHETLRVETLELDDSTGEVKKHTGRANKLHVIKMPMEIDHAKCLFGLVSIDTSLPKKRKALVMDEEDDEMEEELEVDPDNPSANLHTVTAQTYQNYKTALKWWHAYDCDTMSKVGYPWPAGMDDALKKSIASYKRDIVTPLVFSCSI